MRPELLIIPKRPPFVRVITDTRELSELGYILDDDFRYSGVIIKKGGQISMVKTVVKALEGFEKQFEDFNLMKANIGEEKEVAIQEAIAEVEAKFAARLDRIDRVLEEISVSEEIEVEDEEVTDEAEQTNEETIG